MTRSKWNHLISAGQFEQEKALQCLDAIEGDKVKKCKDVTITEAITAQSPSLATFKKYMGEVKTNAALFQMLYDLADYYNVGRGLTDKQVLVIAELIFEDFYYLTLNEIQFAFKQAMKGKYGKVYDRLDGEVIIGWLHTYNDERMAAIERRNQEQRKREERARITNAVPMPEWFSKVLDNFTKQVPTSITVEQIKNDPVVLEHYRKEYEQTQKEVPFDLYLQNKTNRLNRH